MHIITADHAGSIRFCLDVQGHPLPEDVNLQDQADKIRPLNHNSLDSLERPGFTRQRWAWAAKG